MSEFFRGWKRKLSVVTLLAACLFTVGWVRSLQNRESLYLTHWQVRNAFFSVDGKFGIFQSHVNRPESGFVWITLPIVSVYGQQSVDASSIFNVLPGNGNQFESRFQFSGFDLGRVRPISDSTSGSRVVIPFFFAPYWAIVLPLTLLSTWMLLSKSKPFAGRRRPSVPASQEA